MAQKSEIIKIRKGQTYMWEDEPDENCDIFDYPCETEYQKCRWKRGMPLPYLFTDLSTGYHELKLKTDYQAEFMKNHEKSEESTKRREKENKKGDWTKLEKLEKQKEEIKKKIEQQKEKLEAVAEKADKKRAAQAKHYQKKTVKAKAKPMKTMTTMKTMKAMKAKRQKREMHDITKGLRGKGKAMKKKGN